MPDQPGPREQYTGVITKFGLDVGATTGGRMVWAVFAETNAGRGALAGDYTGATGEATIALGLGANVLAGGSTAPSPCNLSRRRNSQASISPSAWLQLQLRPAALTHRSQSRLLPIPPDF